MRKIIALFFASSLFVSFALANGIASIKGISGSGTLATETREINAAYTRISLSGAMDVVLESGRGNRIEVAAEDNLIPYIKTRVSGGKLKIGVVSGRHIRNTQPIIIRVPLQEGLVEVSVSGSGAISSNEKISGRNFSADVQGSGDIALDLSGISGTASADVQGSGDIELDLSGATGTVSTRVQGSGDITVALGSPELLKARISGSGDILYSGNPSLVEGKTTGSGSLSKM